MVTSVILTLHSVEGVFRIVQLYEPSQGVELSTKVMFSDDVTAYATYSYAKAELTEDAPFLFGIVNAPGTPEQDHFDGKDGDRLCSGCCSVVE